MATRDAEGKASRPRAGPVSRPPKSTPAKAPTRAVVDRPPRRPIQILRDKPTSRSFWVFCDDGSVWVTRFKKGSLRWVEAGPPLPGSPEDRRGGFAAEQGYATEK